MKTEYGELAQLPEKTERFSLRKRTAQLPEKTERFSLRKRTVAGARA